MLYGAFRALAGTLCVSAICSAVPSYASCLVDDVIVSGRVEDAPLNGSVQVRLVYTSGKGGDSAEVTLDGASFRVEIPFLTQSRAATLVGTFREKCDRKPEKVVVTFLEGEQEYDRVSLDFAKDFKKTGSTYSLRSAIVLHGHSK